MSSENELVDTINKNKEFENENALDKFEAIAQKLQNYVPENGSL